MTVQHQQLKNTVEWLSNIEGSGTELISVYIPEDQSLQSQIQELQQEHAEAGNIKSKQTRKRVQGALSKIINALQSYDSTPEGGLVVFSGYIEEQDDYETYVFDEFPEPITDSKYQCDNIFYTDPLEESLRENGDYILIVFDRNDAVIGEVVGTSVKQVDSLYSLVPGKQKAGGQSQARFERLRLEAIDNFYQEIAESVNNRYVDERHSIDGILIGAPEPTKTEFIDNEYLHHELQDKIICEQSVSTTTEVGLRRLLDKCQNVMDEQKVAEERELSNRFFKGLVNDEPYVSYGVEETVQALKYGAVDILLVSDNLPYSTQEELQNSTTEENILEYVNTLAEQYDSDVEFISDSFEEGDRFKNVFGGFGAILRYPLN